MPSLLLCSYPSTGKTTFANLLAERALNHKSKSIRNVIIVNEEMARPDQTKASCYENAAAEKFTRAALKNEFDKYCRSSSTFRSPSDLKSPMLKDHNDEAKTKESTLVILDSMNYIKGFRYELHCIAKAAGQKHAVIWLLCSQDVAKSWNSKRRILENDDKLRAPSTVHGSYPDVLMDELMQRFEPPDQRNRWDQPLYRVDVDSTLSSRDIGDVAENILNRSVYNMHSLKASIRDESQTTVRTSNASFRRVNNARKSLQPSSSTETPSCTAAAGPEHQEDTSTASNRTMEDIIDEILDSFITDVQPLKQGMSTKAEITASVNVLNDVDSICQQVINAFMNSQKLSILTLGAGGSGKVSIPLTEGKTFSIDCKRSFQLIELRRFMRQYIKMVSTHPPTDTSRDGISISFLTYVSSQL